MKKILILFGLTLFISQSNAQVLEPIQFIDGTYYHGDIAVGRKTIQNIVMVNPAAFQEVKSGRSRITWGYILSGLSGAMIGSGVGSLVFGGTEESLDPLTGILGGTAVGVGGLLLLRSGAVKFTNGVEIYNSKIGTSYYPDGVSVNFGWCNNGIGISVRF